MDSYRTSTRRCVDAIVGCGVRWGAAMSCSQWLRVFAATIALAVPTAAVAQVQVDQNFVIQGPSQSFGPTGTVQSADAVPNGNVAGAIETVIADPVNPNRYFIGTPNGGIWRTTDGG